MLMWLVPFSLFFIVGAIALGGGPVTIEGGGAARQALGLVATLAVYLLSWGILQFLLARITPLWLSMALASIISIPMFPAVAAIGFRIVGVRTHRTKGHAAHA